MRIGDFHQGPHMLARTSCEVCDRSLAHLLHDCQQLHSFLLQE